MNRCINCRKEFVEGTNIHVKISKPSWDEEPLKRTIKFPICPDCMRYDRLFDQIFNEDNIGYATFEEMIKKVIEIHINN